jgi:brefeldin A-resistance guanine nucleotide exchange factor 1
MLLCVSDPTRQSVPATVENIADAVTHARFVGTDQASDGVVLMKILQVIAVNFKNNYNFLI